MDYRCNWEYYLNERVQCVSINNSVSNPLPVVSGVPQGSILGPLLLLIFVNDLPDSISSSDLLLFADDAKCAHKIVGVSDCQSLQHDLDIFSWCNLWNLHLNQDKCTLVRYTSKPTPVYYIYSLITILMTTNYQIKLHTAT